MLLLLGLFKALAYGLSLSAFRGGPVFPSMFIGAVLGIALSGLPGMDLAPAIGMGIGAMCCAMLRLPLTSALLATLLMGADGLDDHAPGGRRGGRGVRRHHGAAHTGAAPAGGAGATSRAGRSGRTDRGCRGWTRLSHASPRGPRLSHPHGVSRGDEGRSIVECIDPSSGASRG